MTERSPVEILGAILDEVEGLRRTDPLSHLPDALIREARGVFDRPAEGGGPMRLRDLSSLEGRTIEHVFDSCQGDGDLVLVCSDGAFLVLEARSDGDEAYIQPASYYSSGSNSLADFLCPADQETAGLITAAQRQELQNEKAKKEARDKIERAERAAETARKDLADLEARLARC